MTIAGQHTVHELSDLWAAYGFELDRLLGAAENATLAWQQADANGNQAFVAAYNDARTSFENYRDQVTETLGRVGPTSTPTWDHVLVLTLSGDLFKTLASDVGPKIAQADRLFRQAPPSVAKLAPSYVGIPQPTAPDLDLSAYQLTDTATKAIEKGISSGTSVVVLLLAGALVGLYLARR